MNISTLRQSMPKLPYTLDAIFPGPYGAEIMASFIISQLVGHTPNVRVSTRKENEQTIARSAILFTPRQTTFTTFAYVIEHGELPDGQFFAEPTDTPAGGKELFHAFLIAEEPALCIIEVISNFVPVNVELLNSIGVIASDFGASTSKRLFLGVLKPDRYLIKVTKNKDRLGPSQHLIRITKNPLEFKEENTQKIDMTSSSAGGITWTPGQVIDLSEVLTHFLYSKSYPDADPLEDGYISMVAADNDTVIMIDPDGKGENRGRPRAVAIIKDTTPDLLIACKAFHWQRQ